MLVEKSNWGSHKKNRWTNCKFHILDSELSDCQLTHYFTKMCFFCLLSQIMAVKTKNVSVFKFGGGYTGGKLKLIGITSCQK